VHPSGGHPRRGAAGPAAVPWPAVTRWAIGPAVGRADIPGLCERLTVLVRESAATAVDCDVSAITRPDIATVEALVRLRLTARWLGCDLRIRGAGHRLDELLALTGLGDVLLSRAGVVVEPRGQPEQGEEPLGVEERVDPADPAG
jgi:ABC-type transporter Mla MlaB component